MNVSQELVSHRLFSLFFVGEARKWLVELPRDSISSWEEQTATFSLRFYFISKMMTLRDNIKCFKRLDSEPIHERWMNFKKLVLKFPIHRLPNIGLLKYYYKSLDSANKEVVDQLVPGGIMQKSYDVAFILFDCTSNMNIAWNTRVDKVSPQKYRMTKDRTKNINEDTKNMAKIMTQMDILFKNVH